MKGKRKTKASSVKRGQKFFPGLSGLQAKINEVSEQITDRGLTGPAARDAEDAQERIAKRQAKLARRARLAKT